MSSWVEIVAQQGKTVCDLDAYELGKCLEAGTDYRAEVAKEIGDALDEIKSIPRNIRRLKDLKEKMIEVNEKRLSSRAVEHRSVLSTQDEKEEIVCLFEGKKKTNEKNLTIMKSGDEEKHERALAELAEHFAHVRRYVAGTILRAEVIDDPMEWESTGPPSRTDARPVRPATWPTPPVDLEMPELEAWPETAEERLRNMRRYREDRRQCDAKTSRGEYCRNYAVRGRRFCHHHQS